MVGGQGAWALVLGEGVSLHQHHHPFFWVAEEDVMWRGRSYLFEMEQVGAWALSLRLLFLAVTLLYLKVPQNRLHLG